MTSSGADSTVELMIWLAGELEKAMEMAAKILEKRDKQKKS